MRRGWLMADDMETSADGYCPVAATMSLLNGKWTLHIVHELSAGRKRFNELSRALGAVSSRTLCARLRALEDEGIVTREIKHTIPPWVEYELTPKGRELTEALRCIAAWGERYMQPGHARFIRTLDGPRATEPPLWSSDGAASTAGSSLQAVAAGR